MRRNHNRFSGWTRSSELKALARPMAILLALLFSLTVHINATLAAGGDTILCATLVNNGDHRGPAEQLQIEHCGICIVASQFKSFGLPDGVGLSEYKSDGYIHPVFSVTPVIVKFLRITHIRGPPAPEFNKKS